MKLSMCTGYFELSTPEDAVLSLKVQAFPTVNWQWSIPLRCWSGAARSRKPDLPSVLSWRITAFPSPRVIWNSETI